MKHTFFFGALLTAIIALTSIVCKSSGESARSTAEHLASSDSDNPPEFLAVDRLPTPIKQVNPEYPDEARKKLVEGTVWVKAVVGRDGTVRRAMIQQSDNKILNDSALQALWQWKFNPAMMDGQPVAVWISIPFKFKLNR